MGTIISLTRTEGPDRMPWDDRWTTPTLEQLLEPFEESGKRKILDTLIANFASFDGVQQNLIWYGSAWKWTLEFTLAAEGRRPVTPMAYLVLNPVQATVSIPLTDEVLTQIPIKRLNKYVRENIRSAKRAVELHWALWCPTASTEVDYLTDLFKRKHKILTAG